MKNITIIAALSLLFVAGCGPRSQSSSKPPTTNWLITTFGEHRSTDGLWKISISATDGTLKVGQDRVLDHETFKQPDGTYATWTGKTSFADSSEGWHAKPGWFVFVENEALVWSYDGDTFLWLVKVTPGVGTGSYGPRVFPCPVPQQVLARLNESTRRAIKQN